MNQSHKATICFVVSTPMTASVFLNGYIEHLSANHTVLVVCNFDGTEVNITNRATLKNVRITRRISPVSDLLAIITLYRFLRRSRVDLVHSVSPKAGLITSVASRMAGIPVRIHWFTGQVWVNYKGLSRMIFKSIDKLINFLNTLSLVDSFSQREFLASQGVVNETSSSVLGNGSISGVDTSRFQRNDSMRIQTRIDLNIHPPGALVICFLGRLHKDKGVYELLNVFVSGQLFGDPYLLLVGPDECGFTQTLATLSPSIRSRIRCVPFTQRPENYLAATDIFCIPSHREGFGLSAIEASAMEIPVVASRIYGLTDAISHGETGLLVTAGNEDELRDALNVLLSDAKFRGKLGANGRRRVLEKWQANSFSDELEHLYLSLIGDKAAPAK